MNRVWGWGVDKLDLGLDGGLVELLGTTLGTRRGGLAVELEELANVELGLLDDLHLADEDAVERVDVVARLLDLTAEHLREHLGEEALEVL